MLALMMPHRKSSSTSLSKRRCGREGRVVLPGKCEIKSYVIESLHALKKIKEEP